MEHQGRMDMERRNKSYIDLGAFRGKTLARFNTARPGYTRYAFECSPALAAFDYGPDVNVVRAAAWTHFGELPFYLSKVKQDWVEGSTVFKNKITGNIDSEHPFMVPCMNFSTWLLSNFKDRAIAPSDYIVVKMNVEGAEYELIPHLINSGAIHLISELHIQWHWNKIGLPAAAHHEIVAALQASGCRFFTGYEKLYTENRP
jgi:hypothetical protein